LPWTAGRRPGPLLHGAGESAVSGLLGLDHAVLRRLVGRESPATTSSCLRPYFLTTVCACRPGSGRGLRGARALAYTRALHNHDRPQPRWRSRRPGWRCPRCSELPGTIWRVTGPLQLQAVAALLAGNGGPLGERCVCSPAGDAVGDRGSRPLEPRGSRPIKREIAATHATTIHTRVHRARDGPGWARWRSGPCHASQIRPGRGMTTGPVRGSRSLLPSALITGSPRRPACQVRIALPPLRRLVDVIGPK